MKICAKKDCENEVPKFHITEDGRKHNCQKRKFCFICSPYGQHNTKNFNRKKDPAEYGSGTCSKCGGVSQSGNKTCFKCYFNKRRLEISKKVYDIVGYSCWRCDYDKGAINQSLLEFHHIDPDKKLFGLSTREFVGHAWTKVWKEMQKCVSLCCRCHREYHAGIISNEEIEKIYKNRWEQILVPIVQR